MRGFHLRLHTRSHFTLKGLPVSLNTPEETSLGRAMSKASLAVSLGASSSLVPKLPAAGPLPCGSAWPWTQGGQREQMGSAVRDGVHAVLSCHRCTNADCLEELTLGQPKDCFS